MLKRLSNAQLLGISALLLLLSVAIAILPTVSFLRGFMVGTLHPLEQFDSGETLEFVDPDPYSGYLISMEVDERNASLPPMQIQLTSSDGTETRTSRIDRWNSVMGREYKQFLVIEPPADGRFTIRIDTPDDEDFLIYRRIDDVIEREARSSAPIWIVASIPFVLMIIGLGIVFSRVMLNSDDPTIEIRVD